MATEEALLPRTRLLAIKSWLRAIKFWLMEAGYIWATSGTILLALCVSLYPPASEPRISITGLVLQLLGLLTVARGIHETRKLFGHQAYISQAKDWFKRRPRLQPDSLVLHIKGSAQGQASFGTPSLYTRAKRPTNTTADARLDSLEEDINLLHERVTSTVKAANAKIQETKDRIKDEEQLRQATDEQIRDLLEKSATGGIHLSIMGTVWLFVGTTLSTVSEEIACLLQ